VISQSREALHFICKNSRVGDQSYGRCVEMAKLLIKTGAVCDQAMLMAALEHKTKDLIALMLGSGSVCDAKVLQYMVYHYDTQDRDVMEYVLWAWQHYVNTPACDSDIINLIVRCFHQGWYYNNRQYTNNVVFIMEYMIAHGGTTLSTHMDPQSTTRINYAPVVEIQDETVFRKFVQILDRRDLRDMVEFVDDRGNNLLHLCESELMTKMLIEIGVDVNAVNHASYTPKMIAEKLGQTERAALLITV
jgi:hypothetical protein